MSNKLHIALEEPTEISKLLDAEEQANKTSDFDSLHNSIINEKKAEEEKNSSENTDNETGDSTNGDVSETTDESTEEETSTVTEEDTPVASIDDETKTAQECFRELTYINLSLEDYEEPSKFRQVINKVGEYALNSFKYLGYLGITYGPTIASHVYKGVLMLMGKLTKLLFVGIINTTKYLNRRINSFNSIKADIKSVRSILSELKTKDKQVDLTNIKYSNKKVINNLKISDSVDFTLNLKTLNAFVKDTVAKIDTCVNNDVGSIKHLISQSMTGVTKTPLNLMKISLPTNGLHNGSLSGYEVSDDTVTSFHSRNVLPGDVVLIAHLPSENINTLEETVRSYNNSSLFLGVNTSSYKEIDNVDYMSVDSLEKFLDVMDNLCDLCITHQSLYESVIRNKSGLRYNFKQYFNFIISSKNKVTINNSLIEYVYLKSMFVDKVYLAAAMDIHDYSVKVLTNSLSFTKSNIKQL